MGVYIKDMEIPKSCRDCDIGFTICNRYYDPNFDINDAKIKRHPDCPLVEVKAPHGRLGDLDALCENGTADVHEDMVCDGYVEDSTWGFSRDTILREPVIIESEGKDDG